VYPTTY